MKRLLAGALLIGATVTALLSGCSGKSGQASPRGDAVVVSEWIPVVKELQVRGVTDPVTIVGILTTYELRLASGQQVVGRLPRALATVAFVLGRDVKTAFVARSYSPASAATLLSELKALASKLEDLPGVNGPPRFAGGEPAQLANGVRNFAAMGGIPIPTDSHASAEWMPLARALRAGGFDDPVVVHFVLHRSRLRLKSGAVVEPLDEDARYLTVAAAFGLDPVEYRKAFQHRVMMMVPGGPNPITRAKEGRALLSTLPEVAGVEEVPLVLPPEPVKVYREGDKLIAPPWEAFPEDPTSLRWRMGAGEDYLDRWMPVWRGLPDSVRRDYLIGHPPPAAWREWLGRI